MYVIELEDKIVTTRKVHQCGWCDEKIEEHSKVPYRSFIVADEGKVSEWQHPECRTAFRRMDWSDWGADEGYIPGDFKRGTTEQP